MLDFINRNTKDLRNHFCLNNLGIYFKVRFNLEFGSLIWSNNYSTYLNDLMITNINF